MAELRWILLIAGLVFLAGLTVWELRRPRQGRRDALGPPERSEPQLGQLYDFPAEVPLPRAAASSHAEIPPLGTPLVISLDDPIEPPIIHPAEPRYPAHAAALPQYEEPQIPAHSEPAAYTEAAEEHWTDAQSAPAAALAEVAEHVAEDEMARHRESEPPRVQPGEIVVPALPAAEPVTLIVDWPPEDQRHILSVRVVALNPERLSGRPLRQALAACGFVHGRFGIFHQPGSDGRALVSAANLSKPGVFDPNNMDFQRFRGLGLFTVLPGPLPPAAALDHLLDTASDLAERLQARLQDEHGEPLDEVRLEALARTVHDISNGALRTEPAA